jgi:hypothetical protein
MLFSQKPPPVLSPYLLHTGLSCLFLSEYGPGEWTSSFSLDHSMGCTRFNIQPRCPAHMPIRGHLIRGCPTTALGTKSGWLPCFPKESSLGIQPSSSAYVLLLAISMPWGQNWVVVMKTIWSTKPKIFTIWPFAESLLTLVVDEESRVNS